MRAVCHAALVSATSSLIRTASAPGSGRVFDIAYEGSRYQELKGDLLLAAPVLRSGFSLADASDGARDIGSS